LKHRRPADLKGLKIRVPPGPIDGWFSATPALLS
jgi:TRAP-type C4-dicarboxylate transport system substrate-binding protein